jgi:CheY-like chemotaxis protein
VNVVNTKRLLLVDDRPECLKLALWVLASPEYEMRTAASAAEASQAIEHFEPDLLVLDLRLPDSDGLDLVKRLKVNPKTAHIPIIAMTACAMRGDEERALRAGVSRYITKPIVNATLRSVVAECLRAEAI